MIEKYGLFDSLEGDERVYAETDFALLVKSLGREGVRGSADALKITPMTSGLGVQVGAGMAIVQGRYYALEDDGSGVKTITLTTASTNPRIDRIVLCLNFSARTVTLSVLNGAEAASPTAPALTRNTAQYMISLAQVRVGVGAASLKESDITDERADEALCGLHVDSAQAAMAKALAAETAANAAQNAAEEAKQAAAAAQSTANTGVANAAAALSTANGKITKVTAANGRIAVFDGSGGVKDSGVAMDGFHRCKFSLSGTTLTITTVS